ncbi:hypothetical protein HRbin08_00820 [bacterium HR08]|nr:hypothetical protein HRbin08_00820 [bacterium HR08]
MRRRAVLTLLIFVGALCLLVPQVVWTQTGGVSNPRLHTSYPNLTQAFNDPVPSRSESERGGVSA